MGNAFRKQDISMYIAGKRDALSEGRSTPNLSLKIEDLSG